MLDRLTGAPGLDRLASMSYIPPTIDPALYAAADLPYCKICDSSRGGRRFYPPFEDCPHGHHLNIQMYDYWFQHERIRKLFILGLWNLATVIVAFGIPFLFFYLLLADLVWFAAYAWFLHAQGPKGKLYRNLAEMNRRWPEYGMWRKTKRTNTPWIQKKWL